MTEETEPALPFEIATPKAVWVGRVISGLLCVLLAFSAIGKLMAGEEQMAEMSSNLGLPASLRVTIAVIEIFCVLIYAIPNTSIVGAILLTGYMGGAIFAHLRVGDPPIVQSVVPILVWVGVFLRDERLRLLIPWRRTVKP